LGTFIAPGGLIAIYGQELADKTASSGSVPFPTEVGGTQVLIGDKALPLRFVANGQVNAQVPFDVGVNTQQQLVVRRGTTISVPQDVVVAAAQPAVYTQDQKGVYGNSAGVITNAAYQLNTAASPAKAGDIVLLFCNGLGAVGADGKTVNPLTVSIGGISANVQ